MGKLHIASLLGRRSFGLLKLLLLGLAVLLFSLSLRVVRKNDQHDHRVMVSLRNNAVSRLG